MAEKATKIHIRLELTPCQREQIRQATGREVNALDLGLEALPGQSQPPIGGSGDAPVLGDHRGIA